jgi:hypothetical protein
MVLLLFRHYVCIVTGVLFEVFYIISALGRKHSNSYFRNQ